MKFEMVAGKLIYFDEVVPPVETMSLTTFYGICAVPDTYLVEGTRAPRGSHQVARHCGERSELDATEPTEIYDERVYRAMALAACHGIRRV